MYRRLTQIRVLPFVKAVPFLFFAVSLLFTNNCLSQTFEKWYKTESDDLSYDAVELENSYIIMVNSGDYFEHNYNLKYIKLNYEGKIIDSLNIVTPNGYKQYPTKKIFLLNDSLLVSVCEMENNTGEKCVRFIHFSTDFDLLYDTIICDTITIKFYFDFVLNNDNNIVGVGYNNFVGEYFISVYDIYGNSIGYNTYPNTQTGTLASTIIDIPDRNVYHLFTYWSSEDYFIEINKETLQIDTIMRYPDGFLPRNAIKGLSDSTYFLAGKQSTFNISAWWKLSFVEMNYYGDSVNQSSYLVSPDTNSFYSYNSFSYYNNKIYFGGTYNFDNAGAFPFSIEYRWIFINKLNPDGSIIWQRFYKGDANYVTYKVLATSDGGALILSTKYDWNDPTPYQRDLQMLKVDSTGWYEGMTTGETEYDFPKQILVYPNPVKDKVNFVTGLYNDLELTIYNLQGNLVLSKHLPYSQTVDIKDLAKGVYIYVITGKNGFVEKGKLIKE